MKKATFNITTVYGAKEVSGYVYIVADDRVGVHGENGYWTVSDLLTGCKVADGKTIQKAVLSAMSKAPAIRKAREICKETKPEWIKTAGYNPDKYTECTYQLLTVTPFTQEVRTMKNLEVVSAKSYDIGNGRGVMPIYYNIGEDAIYTTPGQGRYKVTDLIRPNTPEEIKKAVNRWLAM